MWLLTRSRSKILDPSLPRGRAFSPASGPGRLFVHSRETFFRWDGPVVSAGSVGILIRGFRLLQRYLRWLLNSRVLLFYSECGSFAAKAPLVSTQGISFIERRSE